MSEFLKEFVKTNKPQFLKYKKYMLNNDWSDRSIESTLTDSFFNDLYSDDKNKVKKAELEKMLKERIARQRETISYRLEEFKTENSLIMGVIDRVKYLVKKAHADHGLQTFKKFIKLSLDIVKIHTDRVDKYISSVDIEKIESQEVKSDEIKMLRECFAGVTKINDIVDSLNIKDEEANTTGIEFLNGTKAPISMHWVLSEIYPEINKKLETLGVDPEAEADNKLHIYNENPPKYNPDKHYWEQDKEVLSYYFKEFKKLKEGIVIDGYYISGWMYYHMNVFVTPIPQKVLNKKSGMYESKDVIMNPPLRDSDVIIFENHEKQKATNTLFMFIAATRRAAKTTLESSQLGHAATIGKKELLCAGGSTKDLNQIAKNFKTDIQYKDPAFAVFNVSNDWKDKVELGLKSKSNKTILLSTLNIVNTDSGNNVEILAGFTPDCFLYDEAMKGKFIEPLQGLKPALKGADGLIRCFGILSGTGGDESLSVDGYTVLNDPEGNSVLPMDWDLLERGVPEEYIEWKEDKQKKFGTFIPGHMCVDMPKIDSNLGDYVGRSDSEELKKIKLKITDWSEASKRIHEARDKVVGNKIAHTKEIVYIPVKPSEIFMSGRVSPFPTAEAKAHKEYLLSTGLWDRRRNLYRDSSGRICSEISTKPLAEFPHKGGFIDAPFLIFEDLPKEKPKYGTYSAGFDDYATDDSTTTSVATFYVVKSKIIGDPFSEKIVASISFRPERHHEVYDKWIMLMEAYNLERTAFGENFNYNIKDFLDRRHLADTYLAPSLDFSQSFNLPNNQKRKTGWDPRTTKKTLFDLFVDYCNEPVEIEQEDGSILVLKGVQKIDDIGLLDEIIGWGENVNVDRITSAMAAISYCHYLKSSYRWKVREMQRENKENQDKNKKTGRTKSFYSSGRNKSFYRGLK